MTDEITALTIPLREEGGLVAKVERAAAEQITYGLERLSLGEFNALVIFI